MNQQELGFRCWVVRQGLQGRGVPCKPAAPGSPAAGVHGSARQCRGPELAQGLCVHHPAFSKNRRLTQKQN